ncbi:hypothetical protein RHGRI_011487 [Rhododendron griersonianum]|uniref:Uncharacterized protein n=1 Tax=Rhododendron griersonianum TaxID=479676 RepID=A0AAV6KNE5_9ERIC|nr:hypothetical protein RHGRI_011487 [Rhododendron griersonianum]
MSKRGGAVLQEDVPWRASPSVKPVPKIHHSPVLRLPQTPYSNYALSVMKEAPGMEIETEWKRCAKRWQVSFYVVLVCGGVDISRSRCGSLRMSLCGEMEPWQAQHPNPVRSGLGNEAMVESAGPDCIIPGQITPIRLLGLKVWPIYVDLTFLEPVGRQLKTIGKIVDSACDIMDKSFADR